jgi:multidrug resistance efflux pump
MPNVRGIQRTLAESRSDGTAVRNGSGSLSDRVQALRLAGRGDSARPRLSIVPWGLSFILLLVVASMGYRTYREKPRGGQSSLRSVESVFGADRSSDSTEPRPVASPVASSGGLALQAKGYIIPAHQIQVSPNKVSGILDFVNPNLEEGNYFREGDVLACIQDKDFRARRDKAAEQLAEYERRLEERQTTWPRELDQARATITVVKAKAGSSKVKYQIAMTTWNATSTEQRVESEAQYNQDLATIVAAEAALHVIEARGKEQIEQAKHRIEQARADLTEAQWMLDNCQVRAPVTGTILKKSAERGNFVNPSALSTGAGGIAVSLCEMADLTDLEVDLKIQERDIANVEVGQRCMVMPEAYESFEPFRKEHPNAYDGTVSRMMPTADRSQGAIPVRVKLRVPQEEQGKYLRPDMGVTVTFLKVRA